MQKNIKKVQTNMKTLIKNIISYLEFLNTECELNVSVHFDSKIFELLPAEFVSEILPYNCHTNMHCITIKKDNHKKCLMHQKDILSKCIKAEGFCSACHAQVYEFIHPFFRNGKASGYVAVSGYTPDSNSNYLKYLAPKKDMPVKKCNAVIPPLCALIEHFLSEHIKMTNDEYILILQFLNEYHTNITLEDLSTHFCRSKSHISHLFKTKNGLTIRAYCNKLKLSDSEKMLTDTDIPITEVAFDAGFNDVSYYIYLFKKEYGLSPLQYRNKKRELSLF